MPGGGKRSAPVQEAPQRALDLLLGADVDRARRLVEDQDARVGEQRPRECDELALSEREPEAALADPRILILDEATSSVDIGTERQIERALRRLLHGRTAFVIAHRLSTIRDADLIVVLEHGRVVEQGTHDELLAAEGRYGELYRDWASQAA